MKGPQINLLLIAREGYECRAIAARLGGDFKLLRAQDLQSGLESLCVDDVQALLLDAAVVKSQGLEWFFEVQRGVADVPVLVLGEEGDGIEAEEAARLGAHDYLSLDELGSGLLQRAVRYAIERHAVRCDLREKEEQLRQVQKLEAVGRLAGGVAHDFNNMLSVILGFTELAQGELEEGSPIHEYLQEVHSAGERARSLTRQLLAFSRRQLLCPEVLDLNEIVTDLGSMLRRTLGEDIDLVTVPQARLGRVKADPHQIEQVILSLAINARDAMPNGGTLSIETSDVFLDEEYAAEHVGVKPGNYVMLALSDTGSGIEPEYLPRIFEPFFSGRDYGQGAGLGLATVYGIVKQSRGNIWVYSEPKHGTTFKIYLPLYEDKPAVVSGVASEEMPGGNETILLVEDEPMVRQLMGQLLERQGYRVLEAGSADEAMHIFHTESETIGLLLTDVVMPRVNGRELADRLSAAKPALKVLFMSGYTRAAIGARGLLPERISYISKPVTMSGLAYMVRHALGGAPYREGGAREGDALARLADPA